MVEDCLGAGKEGGYSKGSGCFTTPWVDMKEVGGREAEWGDTREGRGNCTQLVRCFEVVDAILVELLDGAPLLSLFCVDGNELVGVLDSMDTGGGTRERGDVLLVAKGGLGARCVWSRFLCVTCTNTFA